jgi:hypothetical protein
MYIIAAVSNLDEVIELFFSVYRTVSAAMCSRG